MLEPAVITRCPPLVVYSEEESKALGRARIELRKREPESIILKILDDAHKLRESCRAIEAR